MSEVSNGPPPPAGRAARRAAERKRRLPLWVLVAPVVLAGLGVGLILLLTGDGGGLIGGGDDGDDDVPTFAFTLGRTEAIATSPDPDVDALQAEAEGVAGDVKPVIDALFTNAFLDPANWRENDYAEVFGAFADGAAPSAEAGVETLTLGATAGDLYERVTPERGSVRFTILFDPAGEPHTAVADLRFTALGERQDGTFILVVSDGQLFLRNVDGWRVTAFDVTREDRETSPPPSPAPSIASPTG